MNNLLDTKPRRQHPLLIVFKVILSIKEFIFPIIIFFFVQIGSESNFIKYGSLAIVLYILYRLIVSIFVWKNTTYLLTNKNIELVEGQFISKKRVVALDRIQSHHQQTTFFHKLFKLTSLTMVTGTDNVKLEVITEAEVNRITKLLKDIRPAKSAETIDMEEAPIDETMITEHYQISFKEIVLISFTSFYFLAIIPVLLTIYNRIEDVFSNVDKYTQVLYDFIMQSWLIISFVIILAIIISIIIGLIITYLRFGKYRVASDDKRIYISKGVLNTTNYTIPRDKINGIIIQKNFPRRFFGIFKVKIVSLGDIADDSKLETDVLFPFIFKHRMEKLLPEIIPEYPVTKASNRLPKQALLANLLGPGYFIFLAIVTAICLSFWPKLWYIPLAIFVLFLITKTLEVKQARYYRDEQCIQLQTGAFSLDLFVTHPSKIDELEMKQSWIQRSFNLASLVITTREKPIHQVTMSHLPKSVTTAYYHWYADEILQQKDH